MTVAECLEAYIALSEEAFTRRNFLPVNMKLKAQARFGTDRLEAAIRHVIASSDRIKAEEGNSESLLRGSSCRCNTYGLTL